MGIMEQDGKSRSRALHPNSSPVANHYLTNISNMFFVSSRRQREHLGFLGALENNFA